MNNIGKTPALAGLSEAFRLERRPSAGVCRIIDRLKSNSIGEAFRRILAGDAHQCLCLLFSALISLAFTDSYAAPGDRDRLYGTADIARDGAGFFFDGGQRVLTQPDGKVVLAGFRRDITAADTNNKVSVWRFNADASRDNTFGPAGDVFTTAPITPNCTPTFTTGSLDGFFADRNRA